MSTIQFFIRAGDFHPQQILLRGYVHLGLSKIKMIRREFGVLFVRLDQLKDHLKKSLSTMC